MAILFLLYTLLIPSFSRGAGEKSEFITIKIATSFHWGVTEGVLKNVTGEAKRLVRCLTLTEESYSTNWKII